MTFHLGVRTLALLAFVAAATLALVHPGLHAALGAMPTLARN